MSGCVTMAAKRAAERFGDGTMALEPVGRYVHSWGAGIPLHKYVTTESQALAWFYRSALAGDVLVGPRGTTVRRMVSGGRAV